jgi:hypothetical protein
MRHEQIDTFRKLDEASLALVWPNGGGFAPPGIDAPAPAVPDVPAAVGKLLVGIYAALIGVFFLTLAGSRESAFMIAISGLYVTIFCAVPWIFLKVEKDPSRRPDLAEFMAKGLETWTGHCSGRAALVQMLIVPAMLTLCLLCIGVTARILL